MKINMKNTIKKFLTILIIFIIISFFLPTITAFNIYTIKGAVYLDNKIVNSTAVTVKIEFNEDEYEQTKTFIVDEGYNYNLGFKGHTNKTGQVRILYNGSTYIPLVNKSIYLSL